MPLITWESSGIGRDEVGYRNAGALFLMFGFGRVTIVDDACYDGYENASI